MPYKTCWDRLAYVLEICNFIQMQEYKNIIAFQ